MQTRTCLNQTELAARWTISARTLERWRWTGEGPAFLKIGGRVVYRLEDVLAYEQAGTSAAFWPAYGLNAVTVGAGEAIACLVLGVLLVKQLPKIPYFRNRLAS